MECENLSAKEIDELLNYSDGKEILSQAQIDELLQRIDEGKQKLKSICEKKSGDTRKVKTFDFKRPDILGNRSLRNLTIIMEDFSYNLTDFLQREYGFKAKVNVNSVDQLTREEFVHCIPIPSFISAVSWLGGYIALNMNPNTFLYGILKRKPVPDRYKNLSFKEKLEKVKELAKKNKKRQKKPLFGAFEEKIFSQFFSQPIFSLLLETFQKKSDSPLLQFEKIKFENNAMFLPYTESICEMGILCTLEICFEGQKDKCYLIDVFFNETVIEALCEKRIISKAEKLMIIPFEKPIGNVVAEIGRCHLSENFVFKKNQVLELNSSAGKPLLILTDGKKSFYGDALALDDSRAVCIVGEAEVAENNFYNVRAVWGSAEESSEEISGYGEGTIIELSEKWYDPVYIYRGDKLCAFGQVYITNEHFAVKITEVKE